MISPHELLVGLLVQIAAHDDKFVQGSQQIAVLGILANILGAHFVQELFQRCHSVLNPPLDVRPRRHCILKRRYRFLDYGPQLGDNKGDCILVKNRKLLQQKNRI